MKQTEADLSKALKDLCHDIRSPLQIIQSYIFLLEEDTGPKKKDYLTAIQNAVQKITDLLEQAPKK